ncbi:hypothetical protein [Oryzomicrobium sp.]|uniref:hypothetical protein n=1 Tax=Oryzomicrobium sp. TaxID=1911578 RepID=UPI002FDFCA5C
MGKAFDNIRQGLDGAIAHGKGQAYAGVQMRRPRSLKGIGAIALVGVVVFGVLAILWEIVKQPLALIYGLVGLGVGYALVRAVWMAAA